MSNDSCGKAGRSGRYGGRSKSGLQYSHTSPATFRTSTIHLYQSLECCSVIEVFEVDIIMVIIV